MAGAATYVLQWQCPQCQRAYFGEVPLLTPACPACGAPLRQASTWNLLISGIPDMRVVPQVQVQG